MINLLPNPSFEDGWYHPDDVPELQIPNGWDFEYAPSDEPNPIDPADHSKFKRPEVRVLPVDQLPVHEQDIFILDGDHTLKIFKGYGAWRAKFTQIIALESGVYRFTVKLWPDLIKKYVGSSKVWADDSQKRDGLMRFLLEGEAGPWQPVEPPPTGAVQGVEHWRTFELEFSADGEIDIGIEIMCPFALDNSGVFADGWTLERVADPAPPCRGEPRVQYERTYHLLAPETTREQAQAILEEVYGYQSTIGWSADDAGIGGLDAKQVIAHHFPDHVHQKYRDFFKTHYPGVQLEFRYHDDPDPPTASPEPPPVQAPTILSGYHLQSTFHNWLQLLAAAHDAGHPMGVVRLINTPQLAQEIKAVSPDTFVVFRYVDDNRGKYWAMYPDTEAAVTEFTRQFWPDIERWGDYIDAASSLNETAGTGDSPDEIINARNTEWFDGGYARWVYKETGGQIRSEILTLPAGNPGVGELARLRGAIEAANETNAILGPHTYPPAKVNNWATTWRWLNENGYFYHMRPLDIWVPEILEMGLEVPEFIFGETGPVASFENPDGTPGGFDLTHPGGLGWRVCLSGNLFNLIELMSRYSDLIRAHPWGHKVLGWCFFTSGRVGWSEFQLNEDGWPGMIAAHLEQFE